MANTALNRTTAALLTNKSGGALVQGDVVILDNINAKGFTTTTTAGLSTRGIGVILEPNGIANNATGLVAIGGWIPKINLNAAATIGQFIKTHTVAGQGTPHSSPQASGDFAVALQASAAPEALLFGGANEGSNEGTIALTIDGGGSTITTGIKGDVHIPIPIVLTEVVMLADQSGSIVVDIWKDSYTNFPPTVADTITAAAKPTITTATKSKDSTLTGWTTSVAADDVLRFNVDSVTTIQRVLVALKYRRA